jgi:hypothetical protein
MTIPRLTEMVNYWVSNPPLHLMVKWYLGLDSKTPSKPMSAPQPKYDDIGELVGMFSDGVIRP